jgi:plastocyanin
MTRVRSFHAASARRPLLRPALAVLALTVLAACGGGGGSSQSPVATTTVDLPTSYRFAPSAITVPAGSTVTWANHDNFTHNVSLEGFDPLTMAPGESATHAFATPGLYLYVCSLHPKDMKGSVLVAGG